MLPILRKRNGFVLLDLLNFGLNIQLPIITVRILKCQLFWRMKPNPRLTPKNHMLSSPSYILEMIMKIVFNIGLQDMNRLKNGEGA
jgi:hypothetical protein